jgi:hypothetical protein
MYVAGLLHLARQTSYGLKRPSKPLMLSYLQEDRHSDLRQVVVLPKNLKEGASASMWELGLSRSFLEPACLILLVVPLIYDLAPKMVLRPYGRPLKEQANHSNVGMSEQVLAAVSAKQQG